ncbi:sodium:solute symporter [Ornithinimicrobium sp. LYQ92]|uniref:sodium:solute symporter family protein n=1 Tax=Serinicoccus sp. LYQ92 TaxID=3378798 RepID=UPI003855070A
MFTEGQQTVLAVTTVLYFLFLLGVSVWIGVRQIRTYDDFNVASRNVSLFPLILTYVGTAIGGSLLLGIMTNGYVLGMGQQWFNIMILVVSVIMALFVIRRIRELGEEHRYVTIGDFTAHRFGPGARIPTTLSVLTAYCAVTGMQFVSIALVLDLIAGIPLTQGILISCLVLTLKTVFGGLKAVIWQDAVHGTLQTVAIFGLFVLVLVVVGDMSTVSENARAAGEGQMVSLFGIGAGEVLVYALTVGAYQLIRQDLWQRAWAARDLRTVMTGYWISIVLMTVTIVMVVWIGVWARFGLGIESADPALIYYEVINELVPFPVVVVLIVALMATVISCADSFFMCGASSIVNDVIRPRLSPDTGQRTLLRWSRAAVVITSAIALALALAVPRLVELWVTGTAMLVSGLLFPALMALYLPRVSARAGIAAMWSGLGVAVLWALFGGATGVHPVLVGFPVSVLTFLAVQALDSRRGTLVDNAGSPPRVDEVDRVGATRSTTGR